MDLPYFLTYLRVFLYWIWIRMQILINLFALILMFFGGKYIKEGFFHVLSQYLHIILFL